MEIKILKPYFIALFVIFGLHVIETLFSIVVAYLTLEYAPISYSLTVPIMASTLLSVFLISLAALLYFKTSIFKKVKKVSLKELLIVVCVTIAFWGLRQGFNLVLYPEEIASAVPKNFNYPFYSLLTLFGVLIIAPVWEEILFRGQLNIFQKSGQIIIFPIIFMSIIFSAVHFDPSFLIAKLPFFDFDSSLIPPQKFTTFVWLFFLGIMLSFIYEKFGLLHSMLSHFIFNLLATLVQYNLLF